MTFRRAEPDDLDAVVDLTERAYAPYTEAFGAPPIPVTEDYRPRIAAGQVWLLEGDGKLVGLIVLEDGVMGSEGTLTSPLRGGRGSRSEAGRTSGRGQNSLLIFSVAVAPERQGEGIGQRLLSFAEEQARMQGCGVLALYTNAWMERNIAIYRRFGFEEIGRRSNPLRPGWIAVDMEKTLAPATTRRTA